MLTVPACIADRLRAHAERWHVHVDRLLETRGSLVALGRRAADDVALKLLKHEGDEWWSGEIVRAFAGRGVVLVLEHTDGALLLERLMPGHPLVDLTLRGADEEATAILARVVSAMRPDVAPRACATVEEWGRGFDRYLASHARHVSRALVERARLTYAALAGSQRDVRLLHGDLQQSNVLFDHARGWIAIDPKGVVGELAYELGAFLRNPVERPGTFLDPDVIERRVAQLASTLNVDRDRVIGWAFAQAVLSSIWSWEDGERVAAGDPVLVLAERLEAMLPPDCAPGEHSP